SSLSPHRAPPPSLVPSSFFTATSTTEIYTLSLHDALPILIVYIPEYVVGRWWEQVLHNQSALRLKSRLLYERGVMVTSVPWQLSSSDGRAERTRSEPIVGRWGGPEAR